MVNRRTGERERYADQAVERVYYRRFDQPESARAEQARLWESGRDSFRRRTNSAPTIRIFMNWNGTTKNAAMREN